MNRLTLIVAVLVATPSLVRAQPALTPPWTPPTDAEATRYLGAALVVGGSAPVAGPSALLAVDGGARLSPTLWAHGEVSFGDAVDDQGAGHAGQLRAGLEKRACLTGGILCGVIGADLGYQHGSWASHSGTAMESVDALVVVPRAGIDAGGDTLRVRLGLEVDTAIAGVRGDTDAATTALSSGAVGGGLSLGLAYQW